MLCKTNVEETFLNILSPNLISQTRNNRHELTTEKQLKKTITSFSNSNNPIHQSKMLNEGIY